MVHHLPAVGPGANDVPSLSLLLVSGFGLRTGPSGKGLSGHWSRACPYCPLESLAGLLKKGEAWTCGYVYKKDMVDRGSI